MTKSIIYLVIAVLYSYLAVLFINSTEWATTHSGFTEGSNAPFVLTTIFTSIFFTLILGLIRLSTGFQVWPVWMKWMLTFIPPFLFTLFLYLL